MRKGSPHQYVEMWNMFRVFAQTMENNTSFSGLFFPTCQVRVVRFYVSLISSSSFSSAGPQPQCSLSDLNHDHPRPVFPAGPQPRPSAPSVPCQTSTTTIRAQCSLPDLNHDHPRPVFPAGPQPRPSAPSVPCQTSTMTIRAQCSLPDLNHDHPCPVFPAGPQHTITNRATNTQPLTHNHKHTTTSTQPQTHNHKHTATNTQPQTHNHKHNNKHATTNTTTNTTTSTQPQTQHHKHTHTHGCACVFVLEVDAFSLKPRLNTKSFSMREVLLEDEINRL